MGCAKVMPIMVKAATLCCGCGICESLACSQGISPKVVIDNYKVLLRENKLRYTSDRERECTEEREYRMVSSAKWAATLGVAKFDKRAEYAAQITDARRAVIPLSGHIGAQSVPCVTSGDIVKRGDKIADAREGALSLPQFASISGRVSVYEGKIIIDRVEGDV
jgi:Na+-translocating ferredoxin:NAD+ oxidoreductase RnfC subunit